MPRMIPDARSSESKALIVKPLRLPFSCLYIIVTEHADGIKGLDRQPAALFCSRCVQVEEMRNVTE